MLLTIKRRSQNTVLEYRLDLLQLYKYVAESREEQHSSFQFADIEFLRSHSLGDMYGFHTFCHDTLNSSPCTRTREIVTIRQFWKYLKTKVHLIENNITEESETPKRPKRIVRCLTLEESVRPVIKTG
jgi:integrase/recombinase XerD